MWTGLWDGDGNLQWGWRGNLSSIDIILEREKNSISMLDKLSFLFVCFLQHFFFFFLPSHQICLSHPHSVCGFATNGCRTNAILCCYQRLLLCFFLHVLSKSWTKTNTNPNQNKQKKARFVHFSFFFWSLPPLFVVISHSCFVSFVSISKCPPPLGLWGTTHTAIWPTTTTGWEETPAETTG